MNSKRLNGHRLLFVIALIGILSTHVISAEEDEDTSVTSVATTEEVPQTEDQSTAEDSTEVEAVSSVAQETPEAPTGEMGTSAETSVGVGAGTTVGGGVEATASAEELSSTGAVSVQVQAGSDVTVLDSSREGTEDGTTAIFTGAPSTGKPEVEYTTGRATAEETTASVEQTKETATAEHTTSAGHPGVEGQRETTGKEAEQSTASISSLAPSEQIKSCETCNVTRMKLRSTTWIISGSICRAESENKYDSTLVIRNQRQPSLTKNSTKESTHKPDCSTLVNQFHEGLRKMLMLAKKRSNTPSTTTTTTMTTATTVGVPANERKRRQADEETTSEPDIVDTDVDVDIDDILNVADEVLESVTKASSEITSPQSRPTHSLAESGKASSATLTTAPIEVASKPVEGHNKSSKDVGIWEAHYGFFLTVVILISVCVVVSAVCCLCMAWRRRGQDKYSDKQPIAMEEAREGPAAVSNPIPDAEMIQDEAPMQERENPAVTPNGGGQHISKADEDNGWVVPLDELSKAEKEKPEVENTRL